MDVESTPGGRNIRRLAALGLVALLVSACATPPPGSAEPNASAGATAGADGSAVPSPTDRPTPPPARWSDCGSGFQCASVTVPLDHSGATRGVVNLSLIRRPAADRANRIGSLIVNPGGPGGSGVEFVREGSDIFGDDLLERFDLVGFDPRGVNLSTGVRCIDDLDPRANLDPSPDDAAELAALLADAEAYAGDCALRNAELLPFLSTDDVVADLEWLRASLGDEQLTYLGFSYGTLIGSLYADRYPDRVRAMVLDGAIDPSIDLVALRTGQAKAFEAALGRFLADCAGRASCVFKHGRSTAAAFDALMARIDAQPIPASQSRSGRKVGPGLAAAAVLGALYSKDYWVALEAGLALAERGDGSLLLLIADPFRGRKPNGAYSNQIDAYTSNTCVDFPVSTDPADYTQLAAALEATAPHFAQQVAYNDLACAFWGAPPTRVPAPVRAAGAPPIVVIGTSGDPATPPEWAASLADQLASGVLVTYDGEGHTAFASSTCVRDVVTEMLVELEEPPAATAC